MASCNDSFLDRFPLDEVTDKVYFSNPKDLETYLNQFYSNANFPKYGNHGSDFDSDNQVLNSPDLRLAGTRTLNSFQSIGFSDVRSINYFLSNYEKVAEKNAFDTYKQYVGEAYFFKALIYFKLLKAYGDIQWLDKDLNTTSPELTMPRTPRNIVADRIIGCLDTAAMYLQTDKTSGAARLNKWIALQLQSRVALYEGTWQKYHNGTPFGVAQADPNKYFNKAVEAAESIMNSGLYSVYSTNNPNKDYKYLFSQTDYTNNSEVLFWRKYDNDLSKGQNAFVNDRNIRMQYPSNRTLTKDLADSYLCKDGLPISVSSLFGGYTSITAEVRDRDPRMQQTIATPSEIWKINTDNSTLTWNEVYTRLNSSADYNVPTGYINHKGYDPDVRNHMLQYEETPSILYRYGEVLLNYIEAKAELGSVAQADLDKSINKLRQRVGMPNLTVNNITVDPNWDFPTLSPLINEIRRERRVELAAEGFRWDDIARWAAADELIVNKRPKGMLASQLVNNIYPVDANGFLDPFSTAIPNGYEFKIGRDYLNAIPQSELVLNSSLTQNPGW